MEKYLEFKDENRVSIVKALDSIDMPQVNVQINRKNKEYWSLTIKGSDNDVPVFIDKLEELDNGQEWFN